MNELVAGRPPGSGRLKRLTKGTAFALVTMIAASSYAAVGTAAAATTASVASAATPRASVPAAPVARMHLSATRVVTGNRVVVSTRGTRVPAQVRSVVVSFGDHTAKLRTTHVPRRFTHRFQRLGGHTITMRVVDRLGRMAIARRHVQVRPRPATPLPPLGASAPTEDVQPDTTLRSATALPDAVDLRTDAVPVMSQDPNHVGIGSCVTWAINYALLGWYSKHTRMAVNTFAPMYSYSQVDGGRADSGSRPEDVLNIALHQGVDTAAHYGSGWAYDYVTKPNASQQANAANYKISGWRTVFANADASGATSAEIYNLRAQLASGYPAVIGMKVYQPLRTFHGTGAYTDPAGATFAGYHEVMVIGYDATGLLIQNSWGTGWGDNGFFRLSWTAVSQDVMDANVINGFVPGQSAGDTTAPTATAPVQRMAAGDTMNANGVPVTVSWSGSDNSGSVAGYDLYASTNGGAWTQQTLSTASATSITYSLAPGNRYVFAVRARDAAGNASSWMYGPSFLVSDHPETDASVSYSGSWKAYPWSAADGGQIAMSSTYGDYVSFTFTGRNVAWIGTMATNRGQAYVYLDGNYVFTKDLYSATTKAQALAVVGNWDTSAQHTLTIQVVGTSGRPDVDVDSFVVLG